MSKYSPWYVKYALKRKPDRIIAADSTGREYLHRWHLIPRNGFLNIYLHRFVGPDKRTLHDHPWVSLSYLLDGFLVETYKPTPKSEEKIRVVKRGVWTYRNSTMLHYFEPSILYGAWTLFLTGPKIKKWGFLQKNGAMNRKRKERV
jgi:hypothetical protein